MSKKIEFFFDFGSPTAYLAHTQLAGIAKEHNAELVYEPILLGGVHKATNNTPPGLVPAKGKYMLLQDLPRFIKRYSVPFKMNPHFPVNTLSIMRGCYAAKELGVFQEYVDLMFDGMWVNGLNLSDQEVLKSTLSEAGLDADKLLSLISEDSIKSQLKENTEIAVNKGCFGAPSMFVGNEMFFGQDRLDFLKESLEQ